MARRPGDSAVGNTEHFDVVIVGAGISGIGGGLSPDQALPRHELRDPRNSGKLRRHVANPPLPRGSGRTATCIPSAIVSSRGSERRSQLRPRSALIWVKSSMRTTLAGTSAIDTRSIRRIGRVVTIYGRLRRFRQTPGRPSASPRISSGCARDTIDTRRVIRPNGRAWTSSRAESFIRRHGRKTLTTRTRRSSSSAPAPRRRRSFRRSPPTRATSLSCSVRRLISFQRSTRTSSLTHCVSSDRRIVDP